MYRKLSGSQKLFLPLSTPKQSTENDLRRLFSVVAGHERKTNNKITNNL